MSVFSSTVREMIEYLEPVLSFVGDEELAARAARPDACDLQFGNPQEMPLPEIEQALTRWAVPQNKNWFAYKFSDPSAIRVAVDSLREHVGITFDPDDVLRDLRGQVKIETAFGLPRRTGRPSRASGCQKGRGNGGRDARAHRAPPPLTVTDCYSNLPRPPNRLKSAATWPGIAPAGTE